MRVEIHQVQKTEDEKALIYFKEKTREVEQAVALLQLQQAHLSVTQEGRSGSIPIRDIYYIESVDKKTYVYTKTDCYESKHRLYELEAALDHRFHRCAKAMIVNITKIRHVHSQVYGRMEAHLFNGETVIIARSYVKDFKKGLGL